LPLLIAVRGLMMLPLVGLLLLLASGAAARSE
jgi:hypothetical protein